MVARQTQRPTAAGHVWLWGPVSKLQKKMAGHTLPVQAKWSGIPCRNLWDVTLTNRHRMQCAGVLTRRQGQAIVFGGAVSSFRGTQLRHDGAAAQAFKSRHVDAVAVPSGQGTASLWVAQTLCFPAENSLIREIGGNALPNAGIIVEGTHKHALDKKACTSLPTRFRRS